MTDAPPFSAILIRTVKMRDNDEANVLRLKTKRIQLRHGIFAGANGHW